MADPVDPRRLSRWEVLGAWLHVWTPPRDVEVPPLPARRLAIGALASAIAVVAVVLLGIPAITDSNRDAASRTAERDRVLLAERLRRQAAEQVPVHARGTPASDLAGRRALVGRLERAVGADARARVRTGALRGPILRVDCAAAPRSRIGGLPEDDPARMRGGYDCTAVTSDIRGTSGSIGYPFLAVIDFTTGRLTWCKTNPPPGERSVVDPGRLAELPAECRDPGRGRVDP
jgi:hypothetical protein